MSIRKNNANAIRISKMSPENRSAYLASGRVVVDHIDQAVDNAEGKKIIKRFYVAKIRGVIVGNKGKATFETPEAAKAHGQRILAAWKAMQ
jgi:hypothetical protein